MTPQNNTKALKTANWWLFCLKLELIFILLLQFQQIPLPLQSLIFKHNGKS